MIGTVLFKQYKKNKNKSIRYDLFTSQIIGVMSYSFYLANLEFNPAVRLKELLMVAIVWLKKL